MACTMTVANAASPLVADEHHDLYDITNWYLLAKAPTSDLEDLMNSGYRPIDLQIVDSSPWRFDCAMVANSGNYQSGWWWYTTETEASLRQKISKHNARLIDIEPHLDDKNRLWYAALLKPNSGSDAVTDTDWATNLSESQVDAWSANNPGRRIHDIQPYVNENGSLRYAITWIGNTGPDAVDSMTLTNDTFASINSTVENQDMRIVDIERHPDGRWSAVLVPRAPGTNWWWFVNRDPAEGVEIANKLGARIVDYERYQVGQSERIALVMMRNCTDLAVSANAQLRNDFDITTDTGLHLKKLGSTEYARINGPRQFEPASLIKTFHHYHAMRQCAVGADNLNSTFFFPLSQNNDGNSCPDPSDPLVFGTLEQALRDMMEDSNNSATEAIRNRYGSTAIMNTASQFGSLGTDLNHIIGCFCSPASTWNLTTLDDLARLHNQVRLGWLGGLTDTFYDLMANNWNQFNLVVDQELAVSLLSEEDRDLFRSLAYSAGKGGSYDCIGGQNNGAYRSQGVYFRVPHRDDCGINTQQYFAGAWVNDDQTADASNTQSTNVSNAITVLYLDRIRAAIDTWEADSCIECVADFNEDGVVDGSDMGLLLAQWGACAGTCSGDLNGDGIVDGADFGQFLALWGPCP